MPSPSGEIPSRESTFVVFAQSDLARFDVASWDEHARRFFATRIEAVDTPHTDGNGASLSVVSNRDDRDVRMVWHRHAGEEDHRLARDAEKGATTGLADLAHRCGSVWLVERKDDHDAVALRLAVILASVMLGPVLDARKPELFGVKTGRAKLGAR